ncbi:ABC-F family ATP-binding cassette domain-containing protein [bacterium]|jgi:ATP-binding cassette, subfamily F, member 3|nr:ABC-F family ATP-binding cassette domain-containing protein [bacterium]MBT3582053.1 ABC-F family ATP-binding cassette domain-containing protein [bacterium]MBT4552620.1 ABC-F family ATP-binding cassette domain-containing protein [bacterium]MBT5988431.1 ABC-F family ATP-binding cassette domain-containing protein [bacterium]MBT7088114.1 ABC-F family ATP-binding cassette domain-containing protein [bacterium]
MISIKDLCLGFGSQTLFDKVGFNISDGERIGLVGRNGSGKTTLFNLLTEEITPDKGSILKPKNLTIGYVKQHLHFTKDTVIEEACLGLRADDQYSEWKVEKILSGLGFSIEDMLEPPHKFSGGFQIRINLAKVLVNEPDLLLLDEPTNYLDLPTIRWLTQFLKKWPHELMIISHDRQFMDSITNHTLAIHRQKIKKLAGSTIKMYGKLAEEEETQEKTRINDEKKRETVQAFIDRFRSKASLASLVQSKIKNLEKKAKLEKLIKEKALDFKFSEAEFQAKTLLKAKKLCFGYDLALPDLIKNFHLYIEKDDRIAVIGKNGKGKTTLLKLLNGFLEPTKGEVELHPKTAIGYFGQTNKLELNLENTIEHELLEECVEKNKSKVRGVCGAMLFSGDLALKKIKILSGGEKARVLLGKILLKPANLLLLDEPTHHLDMDSCDTLIEALTVFNGAVVIVTHNESFLRNLAKKIIVFDDDKIFIFQGTYSEFLKKYPW